MASSLPPDLCPVHLCLEWTKAFGDCSAFCPAMQARDRHDTAELPRAKAHKKVA